MRVFLLLWVIAIFACEKKAEEEDNIAQDPDATSEVGQLAVGPINDVPKITDQVNEYATAETSQDAVKARGFDSLQVDNGLHFTTATKGLKFGSSASTLETAFSKSGASEAFCRSMNTTMLALANVVEPDLNLCMLQATLGKNYDQDSSDYQFANITMVEEGETIVSKFKFKLSKDSDGHVDGFEAFVCESVDGESLGQIGYELVSKKDGNVSIFVRSFGDEDGLKLRVDMSAKYDENGSLVGLKTIDYAETTSGQGMARKVEGVITQSANNLEFNGFTSSGYGDRQFLSFTELIGKESEDFQFTEIALGDGAAFFKVKENGPDGGEESSSVEGWNGDTYLVDESSSRIIKVSERDDELLTVRTPPNLELESHQKWDCQSSDPIAAKISDAALQACMESLEITQDLFNMCSKF